MSPRPALLRLLSFGALGGALAATGSADPMLAALAAPGPHPSLGEQAQVFGRFVGTWDCDYAFYDQDGGVTRSSGELSFGWVLDGRAMQDVWVSYPKHGTGERTLGTSLRFLDPKSKLWRVYFASPSFDALLTVQGGAEGDRIVLRGVDGGGALLRWSFNDIRADSFVWRGESSRDDGNTWRLEEEHHMRRRDRDAPTAAARGNDDDMIRALAAAGPHPSLGERARLFDRFTGAWDLDCVFYAADGAVTRFHGAWIFGWVLDGRLMQDVLIDGDPQSGRRLGSTLRFYDSKSERWRVVWTPPESGNVITLDGGAEGDRIVLRGVDIDGASLRWSFNQIQANSFVWRGEVSKDGGKSWRLEQEMHLRRHPSPSAIAFSRLSSLVQEWTYRSKGENGTTVFRYTRQR